MKKKENKQRNIFIALMVLVVVLITSLLVLPEMLIKNKISTPLTTPSPKTEIVNQSQTLKELEKELTAYNFSPTKAYAIRWTSSDGWVIIVEDNESIGIVDHDAYKDLGSTTSKTSTIVNIVDNFFTDRGFKKNKNNSSRMLGDEKFYDYINAYEDKNEMCVLKVNPDKSGVFDKNGKSVPLPTVTISCANQDTYNSAYTEQIPFLKALNDRRVGIYLNKMNEEKTAVYAGVSYQRGGSFALFSKKYGYWEVIYIGQDTPECEVLQKYNFPAEIYSNCY